jgi:hypothetical protein
MEFLRTRKTLRGRSFRQNSLVSKRGRNLHTLRFRDSWILFLRSKKSTGRDEDMGFPFCWTERVSAPQRTGRTSRFPGFKGQCQTAKTRARTLLEWFGGVFDPEIRSQLKQSFAAFLPPMVEDRFLPGLKKQTERITIARESGVFSLVRTRCLAEERLHLISLLCLPLFQFHAILQR